jgi:hypothetical protein
MTSRLSPEGVTRSELFALFEMLLDEIQDFRHAPSRDEAQEILRLLAVLMQKIGIPRIVDVVRGAATRETAGTDAQKLYAGLADVISVLGPGFLDKSTSAIFARDFMLFANGETPEIGGPLPKKMKNRKAPRISMRTMSRRTTILRAHFEAARKRAIAGQRATSWEKEHVILVPAQKGMSMSSRNTWNNATPPEERELARQLGAAIARGDLMTPEQRELHHQIVKDYDSHTQRLDLPS